MVRTKSKNRQGEDGHNNRKRSHANEPRIPNPENKKRKREVSKTSTPAKRARTLSSSPETSTRPPPPDTQIADETTSTLPAKTDPASISTNNAPTQPTFPIHPSLTKSYDISTMNIISSSKIEAKVTNTLKKLSTYPAIPPAKPAVVVLQAKANVASKMISVAEIAKREIGGGGGKWFQYNVIESVMERREKTGKGNKKGEGGEGDEQMEDGSGSEDEEEAFETMKTPFERAIEGREKVRAWPVMTMYLSRVRIESLRRGYGEQTNGLEVSQK